MGLFIGKTETDVLAKVSALAKKSKVVAGNIANANTPGYTAKRVDFSKIFSEEQMKLSLIKTNPKHIGSKKTNTSKEIPVRDTYVPVELDEEILEMTKTSMEYQALLRLLSERFGLYKDIIQGRVE